jgi:hypothetical protein
MIEKSPKKEEKRQFAMSSRDCKDDKIDHPKNVFRQISLSLNILDLDEGFLFLLRSESNQSFRNSRSSSSFLSCPPSPFVVLSAFSRDCSSNQAIEHQIWLPFSQFR